MNEEDLINLLGQDRYDEIKIASKEDSETILEAIAVLAKRFRVDPQIGYNGDDFIQNGKTLVIKLRPL